MDAKLSTHLRGTVLSLSLGPNKTLLIGFCANLHANFNHLEVECLNQGLLPSLHFPSWSSPHCSLQGREEVKRMLADSTLTSSPLAGFLRKLGTHEMISKDYL